MPVIARNHVPALEVDSVGRGFADSCDVVVVGSGAGGAVAAYELARAGLRVIVVEEGGHFTSGDFAAPPIERLRRVYRRSGLTFTAGTPVVSLPMGRAVGGSTVINSGTSFRAPDFVLRTWGVDPEAMAPLYEEVESMLGVAPSDPSVLGPNAHVMERGRAALGWSGGVIPRNARGCHGSGVCAFGCPTDAKLGTHLTYLPAAQSLGMRILKDARVRRVVMRAGRAVGVAGDGFAVNARAVVLAAGALHTPDLLMRSGAAVRGVGRHLHIHPAAGVLGVFEEELKAWSGVMQSVYVDERLRDGIVLEATYPPPGAGYSAGSLGAHGLDLQRLVAGYARTAAVGVMIADRTEGHVHRGAWARYDLGTADAERLREGIAMACEVLLAAGATEVLTMLPGASPVRTADDVAALRASRVRPSDLKLSAFHALGTCRMGEVVDRDGAVVGARDLYVMDASVLPGSPYVNPQLTIMALAARMSRGLAARLL